MKGSSAHAVNVRIEHPQREISVDTEWQYMKELNSLAGNATMKQLQRGVLLNKKGQQLHKLELDIHAEIVTIKQLPRVFWRNTKGLYMKESNIFAGNTTIKQLQRIILLNTEGQYMMEFFLVGNTIIEQLKRIILPNTKWQSMKM